MNAITNDLIGYYINYGNTPDPARMHMLPKVSASESAAPYVELNMLRYQGALPGEAVRFPKGL